MAGAKEATVMEVPEEEARAEIRAVAAELRALRFRLLGVHASLPVSPREDLMLLGEEEMDFSTEARSTIECVLHDFVAATIRNLDNLAGYRPGRRSE